VVWNTNEDSSAEYRLGQSR